MGMSLEKGARRGALFVTYRELIEETGLSRRTLYRYVDRGVLEKPLDIGLRKKGWRREYIADFLNRMERGEVRWQQ